MTPILETVFSLIFVFLVFSLITSWIVEYLAMRNQKRGKMLRQFVLDSLDDKFNKNWGVLLYGHPMIDVLHREIKLPKGFKGFFHNNKLNVKRRLPAYIPSDQFATALIDLVIHHNRETKFWLNDKTGRYELVTANIDPETEKPVTQENGETKNFKNSYMDFLKGLDAMKESEVKITLFSLARKITVTDAAAINQLTAAIATWYDNGMERLNGWYKRKIRYWLFGVGLIVAICFNVDTIKVVSRLYADPQLRTVVSQAADRFLKEHQQLPSESGATDVETLSKKIDSLKSLLDPLNLPIGWKLPPETVSVSTENTIKRIWRKTKTVFTMMGKNASPQTLLGWLLTAFAVSFGAPFWFDALKKVSNVRSAGLRPTSKTENNDSEKK